jgi:V/A-type H+/Na+-transporting ATPase subunit E
MSSQELIEALRRAGEEKARLIREETEREAEDLRLTVCRKVEDLRRGYADKLTAVSRQETKNALAEAGRRARAVRLAAEKTLSDRLFLLARSSLNRLREDGYPAVFEKLAAELPSMPWKRVRVHPADAALARKCFPDAEIVPLEAITGGMDAEVDGGKIRIVNTFEKRLERSWDELLPCLIRDVYNEVPDGASPESG